MNHDAAVASRPAWTAWTLFANEAVFDPQAIVGKCIFEKQMAKSLIEFFIAAAVVANLQNPIFDAIGVAEVFTDFAVTNLRSPAGQGFAIKG